MTVVIAAWDRYASDELAGAAESVRTQSIPAELIVVDNASTVPLPALEGAEVVRLERRRSTGAARNASLGLLRTRYVVFLDADDRLLDGALEALVAGLEADSLRATHTLSIIDGATGARYRSPRRLARILAQVPPMFALANATWSLLPTQGCTIMRAEDVISCGGYADSSTGEDWVLAVSLSFRGRQSFEQRAGLEYRPRPDSPGVRALEVGTLLRNAERVRGRIAADPEVPERAKALLPAIHAAQWIAASVVHPAYRSARAALTRL